MCIFRKFLYLAQLLRHCQICAITSTTFTTASSIAKRETGAYKDDRDWQLFDFEALSDVSVRIWQVHFLILFSFDVFGWFCPFANSTLFTILQLQILCYHVILHNNCALSLLSLLFMFVYPQCLSPFSWHDVSVVFYWYLLRSDMKVDSVCWSFSWISPTGYWCLQCCFSLFL